MKRIVFVVIASLFSVLAMAQDREVKQVELKNGNKLTGYVSVQQDGSYLVETTGGDVFFFTSSEVSKITEVDSTATPTLLSTSDKQKKYPRNQVGVNKLVYKRGGQLRFIETGLPLEQRDFATSQGWDAYQSARKLRKAGNILWISGVSVVSVDLIIASTFNIAYSPGVDITVTVLATGCVMTITGITLSAIGNTKIKKIAKGINQGTGYELTFGAQPHGIGLALNF